MLAPRLTLLGKPGCHLCEDARLVVQRVAEACGVAWVEQNILEDAQLLEKYAEEIPVVFIDGRVHAVWRVDAESLTRALAEK